MSGSWSSGSALPLSGGKRRRTVSKRRGGDDAKLPGTEVVAGALKTAGQEASDVSLAPMTGGRHRKMTAKKVVKKLAVLARQAKKLTMRLRKMKKHH
jgi:transposase